MEETITNEQRLESARQALRDFALGEPCTGDLAEDRDITIQNATDLVTNLLHLLGAEVGVAVPQEVVDRALSHYLVERGAQLERELGSS